jgi:hypothetical protein
LFESVWSQNAKSIKEIRNQKKKRRKENKNMKLDLREPIRPSEHFGLGPPSHTRTVTQPSSLPLADMWDPAIISLLWPEISPETKSLPLLHPLFNSDLIPALIDV